MADDKLQTQQPGAIVRPAFLPKDDVRGTEHIGKDDMRIPRLALAQQMSHEVNPTDPKFIEGLKVQDMFNSLTRRIYGRGPLELVVVRSDPPRYIEFWPRDQGGGIKRFNVDPDDPATKFGDKGEPPLATMFYDFVVMLLPEREPIALSLKSTGLAVARDLNGLIKSKMAPIFAGKYRLLTGMKTNKKGTFATFILQDADWVDEDTYHFAEKWHESLKGKVLDIDRDHERQPGDDDFPEVPAPNTGM